MAQYSVSAKTCLAAIALLESRGGIAPAEQGKKRRILVKSAKTVNSLKNLLIIDGHGSPSGEDLLQIRAYRMAWEKSGGIVRMTNLDLPRYRRPAALLRKTVANQRADAILLHVPPLAWVQAAAQLRPVFLSGGEWRGYQITGVGYDVRAEVARCVDRLRQLNHKRIAVPLDFVGRQMEKAVRDGLAMGLGISANSSSLLDCCPVFSERVPAAWQQYWKKTFTMVRPTAIILMEDIHYLSLCGYCFRHGIRIPHDLSIICLESTEHLEWCEPVPTRMRFPVEAAAQYFTKWIRGGCRPLGMKFYPLDGLEGGTVAEASAR